MSGSLRVIDITGSQGQLSPYLRRDFLVPKNDGLPRFKAPAEEVALRATESLASGPLADLSRFGRALDLYRQNMDARRTLLTGPLFIDTYA